MWRNRITPGSSGRPIPTRGLEPPPRHCAVADNRLAVDTLPQPNAPRREAAHHKLALISKEPSKVRRLRGISRT